MIYLNIRGLKSKMTSLEEIIESESPTIVCLTETHLSKEDEISIPGYEIFPNSRDEGGGGGVLVAVKKELVKISVEVGKEKEFGESIWIRINNKHKDKGVAIRIGVVYAPQESRAKLDVYKEMYEKIKEQVSYGEEKGDKIMIVGDFNCKVGKEIPGNRDEVTKSAKYLLKLEQNHQLKILNKIDKCQGKWTRVEKECRSILDYVLVKEQDEGALSSMVIDEEKNFAPSGINEEKETVYSDHNVILCEFNWLFEEADQKPTKKIITKKGYIKAGKEVQERNLKSILEDSSLPFEERFVRWKEETNEIMEKNKIKIKKRNQNKTIRQLMRTRRSVKRQISTTRCKERKDLLIQRIRLINEHIKEEESHQYKRKIDKVVSKLKAKGGINGANTWEVLNQVKGRREEKATAVTSKEGKIIEEPEEIMNRQSDKPVHMHGYA